MSHGSRICPNCGGLNAQDEKGCRRCGKRLPGPWFEAATELVQSALGREAPVTMLMIGLSFAAFLLLVVGMQGRFAVGFGIGADTEIGQMLRFGALCGMPDAWHVSLGRFEPWRYFSAIMLHFSLIHVGMNMYSLVAKGRQLEQRIGGARFGVLYVMSGLVGFLASDAWTGCWGSIYGPTAGASGAVFGVFAADIGELLARGRPEWKQALWQNVILLVVIAMVMSGGGVLVNNAAHLGGLVTGAVLGYLFGIERRPERLNFLMRWLATGLVLMMVGGVLLSIRSPYWKPVADYEREMRARAAD